MSHPHVGIWITGALSVSILGGLAYFWNLNHVKSESVVQGHGRRTGTGKRQQQKQQKQTKKASTGGTKTALTRSKKLSHVEDKTGTLRESAANFLKMATLLNETKRSN